MPGSARSATCVATSIGDAAVHVGEGGAGGAQRGRHVVLAAARGSARACTASPTGSVTSVGFAYTSRASSVIARGLPVAIEDLGAVRAQLLGADALLDAEGLVGAGFPHLQDARGAPRCHPSARAIPTSRARSRPAGGRVTRPPSPAGGAAARSRRDRACASLAAAPTPSRVAATRPARPLRAARRAAVAARSGCVWSSSTEKLDCTNSADSDAIPMISTAARAATRIQNATGEPRRARR